MGAALPVIMIIASAITATAAIVTAVTVASVLTIILAIVSAAATATSIYYYTQGDIKNSMLFAGIGIASGVGGIYIAAMPQLSVANASLIEGVDMIALESTEGITMTAAHIYTAGYTIYSSFMQVLEAIHFKIILQIHQIAYLVSDDYRGMLNRVFGQFQEVAVALGMGADFINLALRNTRNLVLDVSATMGKRYDLSEVVWMSSLSDFMKDFERRYERYSRNPNELLWDLDQAMSRPGIDVKAGVMQAIISGTQGALTLVKETAESLTIIKSDVMRLFTDLPDALKRDWMTHVNAINKWIDDFMRLTYDPLTKGLEKSFAVVGIELDKRKQEMSVVTQRLRRPGRYIKEVTTLPETEQIEDLRDMNEISTRAALADLEDINMGMEKEIAGLFQPLPEITPIPAPEMKIEPKITAISTPEKPKLIPRKTWFVGEY